MEDTKLKASDAHQPDSEPGPTYVDGIKKGLPIALALIPIGMTFGVLAKLDGWNTAEPVAFSALTFSASAQFAAAGVLAAGGSVAAAVVSAGFLNSRFVPMGVAASSAFTGGRLSRALQAQGLVDASWLLASRGDGTFDRKLLIGATVPQYIFWVLGTWIGALAGSHIGDPSRFGLDAVFPAFFLALLAGELRSRRKLQVVALATVITLVLVPLVPPGIPIIAASAASLLALRRPCKPTATAGASPR
ncbi:MAG TPA: AzlC family ABC transporter permease [Streptosporangiaceae bacterium]|nr:AzlC family ABC transporter permease [Streptosporangiaceae bacterium]